MGKILTSTVAGVMLAASAITAVPTAEARHRGGGTYYYQPYYGQPYYGDPYYQPYYGNGYYDNGYRHHRRHRNNAAAAAVVGLALGAIIGGAISNNRGSSHEQRCANRYRSYDPRTDTFIGRDGQYYYCNL